MVKCIINLRVLGFIIVIFLIVGITNSFYDGNIAPKFENSELIECSVANYQERGPIKILNNSAFKDNYGFEGEGTVDEPYLIDSFNITDSNSILIEIRDTTAYFKISNNILNGINDSFHGIFLKNVEHGNITNNIISNNRIGVFMDSGTTNNTLVGNLIYDNSLYGIYLYKTHNNTVFNNTLYENDNKCIYLTQTNDTEIVDNMIYGSDTGISIAIAYNNTVSGNTIYNHSNGIIISSSENIIILSNTIYNNSNYGVRLTNVAFSMVSNNEIYFNKVNSLFLDNFCTNNTISGNSVHDNDKIGIDLKNCYYNSIIGNIVSNNTEYGVKIRNDAVNNTIEWNDFWDNNDEGTSQAVDDGIDNKFYFNYWNEWVNPDDSPKDGIVDIPYDIDGISDNEDLNPIASPSLTPPMVIVDSPLNQGYGTGAISVTLSGNALHYWYYIEQVDNQNRTWTSSEDRTLNDGTYTLHAYGNGSLGLVAHTSLVFTIDTLPPNLLIVSPINATYNNATIIIRLSGDATEYWYYIEGIHSQNLTWTTAVAHELPDGTYKIHAYGSDATGNIGYQSITFTIKTHKPADPLPLILLGAIVGIPVVIGGFLYWRKKKKSL